MAERLTTEQWSEVRAAREDAILIRIGKSLASRAEIEEVRHRIPEEEYVRLVGKPLAESSEAHSGKAQYLHELKDYAETYRRSPRQIKRWIRAGRYAKPPELPPLDAPAGMLAWWNRMLVQEQLKQKPPVILEQFAIDAAKGVAPGKLTAIDVSQLDVAGVGLKQARGFLAAAAQQLTEAYGAGDDAMIGRVQARWEKALSAVRLAEVEERKSAQARGDLLPKPEVLSELSQLIEMVRNMTATMSRRIRARVGPLPPELDAKLDGAIEQERAREWAALKRAKYFGTIEEVVLELDEAAGVAA